MQEPVNGTGEVPGSLYHPSLVRFARDPRNRHGPGLELHHEEDDVTNEPSQGQDLDGEEIGRRERVPMRGEERLPRHVRAPLRCRLDAVILEDRLDRIAGHVVAERLEPTADARVTPRRILLCHADHQRGKVRLGPRATAATRVRAVIFLRHERSIPRPSVSVDAPILMDLGLGRVFAPNEVYCPSPAK